MSKHHYFTKKAFYILILVSLVFVGSIANAQEETTPINFLPGDDSIGPATGDQTSPDVAAGDDMYLAVWDDQRSHASGTFFYDFETASDIYGVRLDALGNPLDTVPFAITQNKASQSNPKVAWNGTHWLVVYESVGLNGTGFYFQDSLAAVRVAPTGEILDTTPISIFNVTPSGGDWDVTSEGGSWVIAFQGSAASNDLQALRITAEGDLIQPSTSLLPETYYMRSNLQVACSGGVCLLTFDDQYVNGMFNTGALLFDSAFNVLRGRYTLLDRSIKDLTRNGANFYIVWHQQLPDYSISVFGSRVNTSGNKMDGAGVNISGSNTPTVYAGTQAVWDGTNWKASWGFNNGVSVARVNPAGQVLDPGGVSVPGLQAGRTAVTNGGGLQVVWYEESNNQYDVFSGYINVNNTTGPAQVVSTSGPSQTRADSAVGANGSMIVYRSDSGTEHSVVAHPLEVNGTPLTPEPIQLASGTFATGPGAPAVAWNGALYLVAWENGTGIVAQRLLQDGTLLDPNPFVVVADGFGPVETAAQGETFLVVGRQFGTSAHLVFPVASRVDGSDGTVLDPTPMTLGYTYARSITVTAFDGRWMVVWQQNVSHDNPLASIRAAFVNTDGTFEPNFYVYGYSTNGGNGIFEVGAAAGNNAALVVQSSEETSGVETDLVGVLVNPDGTTQQPIILTPWFGNQYRPRVAWDGTNFVVVYNDQKNRFAQHSLEQLDARSDLYGMRISETGTILDPKGFVFSNEAVSEANPNVAALNGVTLITGSIIRNEAPFASYRVGYQLLGGEGNAWPVAAAGPNISVGDVPLLVNFNSAGSGDPDGTVSAYFWDFGDGATSLEQNPSHTFVTPGEYVVTLTVTDDLGASTVNAVPVKANIPNQSPVAVASADVMGGPVPLDIVFSAAGSYDPDGSIGNIEWDFGDGVTYWGSPAYHTYMFPGTYDVTLTVYDGHGATGTDTIQIEVIREPCTSNCLRVVKLQMKARGNGGNARILARAQIRDENGSPVAGAYVYFEMRMPDGSTLLWSSYTNAQGLGTMRVMDAGPGTYRVIVTNVEKNDYLFDPDNSILRRRLVR